MNQLISVKIGTGRRFEGRSCVLCGIRARICDTEFGNEQVGYEEIYIRGTGKKGEYENFRGDGSLLLYRGSRALWQLYRIRLNWIEKCFMVSISRRPRRASEGISKRT